MAGDETTTEPVIEPVEQRTVALTPDGESDVLAARTETSEIYLPMRPICAALGITWARQYRKVMADEVLMERVRPYASRHAVARKI